MLDLDNQFGAGTTQSMQRMDIPWMLEQWVRRTPDKPCLIWEPFSGDGLSMSYLELQSAARRVAAGLHERGVKAGDFVILHLVNSPELLISWYACAELGAVAVTTNTRSVARDLCYFAEHTQAVCAITQPCFAQLIHDSCDDLRFLVVTDNDAGELAAVPDDLACITFDALSHSRRSIPALFADPQRNLCVLFTSGTTSQPKAVLWTHANGLWAGRVTASHLQLTPTDITLAFLPMFHVNALGYSMLATHWSGGTVVLQPKFSASRFWDVSIKHKVSWGSTVWFPLQALLKQAVPEHHYRFWGTGAHFAEASAYFKVPIMGWWAMTETLTQGIVTDPHHPGPDMTIGRVANEYEIQIRRTDGSLVGPGESGSLYIRGVRGVSMFKEYYRNPEANAKAFDANGWFETGDNICMDEEGWLFFGDREKDMLRVGDENVASMEVESVIMQTGLVNECAVVGQSHNMLYEVPVVFVIPAKDAATDTLKDDIIRSCQENLADFKVVRDVHIVDTLPRSTLEKVAKNELRALLPEISS
ncbi:AMP-binding protein [Luminiphilus sp.]|nr:AMP-binding protein [Luminiphilus sp.]MDA9625525.1 AMP-binding protein [Luminiphilus sp.]